MDIIGIHLLKSQVCYAGKTYAKTLAYFNDEIGNQYLEKYLDYYLNEPSLFYDQYCVIQAVKYLDKVNHANRLEKYFQDWEELAKQQGQQKEISTENLEKEIEAIEKIKNTAANSY
ncbi:MAG: DUF6000 family protein [Chitinophagales bacterium]